MPNRWIKESCRSSKNLAQVSDMAERLFWRLITTADDFGRFIADSDVVKGVCFSKIERIRIADVSKCLQMLANANLLKLYTIDERLYGYFINWEKHQGPHRALKSKYPDPVDSKQMQTDANRCLQLQTLSDRPALLPDTETDTDLNLNSLKSEEAFNSFWEAYPARNGKKLEKGESKVRFLSLSPADQALCVQAAQNYAHSQRVKDGVGIKDPKRFIHDFWQEWIEPETPQDLPSKPKPLTAYQQMMQRAQEAASHG